MASQTQRASKLRARDSLISNITPKDSIPSEWRSEDRRRLSADDSARIRVLWERYYNIQDTHHPKSRASSEPAIEYPLHSTTDAPASLSSSQSSQPLDTASTVNIASTKSTQKENEDRLWNLLWLQQRFSQKKCHRQVHETPTLGRQDGISSVEPADVTLGTTLETGLQNTIRSFFEPCVTILDLVLKALKWLWWIFRWSVIGVVIVVVAAAILVWVVAAFYTLTSNAFLNSFCEMKLPLIRDMICSGYDSALAQMLLQTHATDFNAEFGTMFEDKNIGTTISLPYYLSNWQTELRWLRSNLPGSRLSEWDEQFFHNILTTVIDLNKDSVVLSQKTFAHLHGTTEYIVSGTASVMGYLDETGFTSGTLMPPEDPHENLLTIGMEWLESKTLVWLPYGLEPFREPRGQPTLNGITRMLIFVQGVTERLRKDQDGIITLRGQLDSQVDILDRLASEAVRCASEENEAKVIRGYRPWYAFLDMIGYTDPEDWKTQQRLQALESMKPIYREQSDYLIKASVQLGSVLQACEYLEDSLFAQQNAVQRGMSASDWLFEQPKVLEKGKEKLVKELKVWNMRKTEANARIFENFG